MKKQFLNIIAVIIFLTTAMTAGAAAQSVKVNIKFDFQVGEKVYPAGEYVIERISRQSDNLLKIRNTALSEDKGRIIITNLTNAGKRQEPKMVFEHNGNSFFLTKIFFDDSPWGLSLKPARKREKNQIGTKVLEVALNKK
jgi:hypothetical protein